MHCCRALTLASARLSCWILRSVGFGSVFRKPISDIFIRFHTPLLSKCQHCNFCNRQPNTHPNLFALLFLVAALCLGVSLLSLQPFTSAPNTISSWTSNGLSVCSPQPHHTTASAYGTHHFIPKHSITRSTIVTFLLLLLQPSGRKKQLIWSIYTQQS